MSHTLVANLKTASALFVIVLVATPVMAVIPFTPLPNSATDAPSGSAQELNSPFLLPSGYT